MDCLKMLKVKPRLIMGGVYTDILIRICETLDCDRCDIMDIEK